MSDSSTLDVTAQNEHLNAITPPFSKIRVALQTGSDLRPVFWIKGSGHDIYWGPAGDRRAVDGVTERPGGCTIDFSVEPDELAQAMHVSLHASGEYHVKTGRATSGVSQVRRPDNLQSPFRLGAIVTGRGSAYKISTRCLTREGAKALLFETPLEMLDNYRHYFELVAFPSGGTHDMPDLLLVFGEPITHHLIAAAIQVSPQVVVVVRHAMFEESRKDVPAGGELWVMRTGDDDVAASMESIVTRAA